ncbi:serine hydrolase [Candidatus Saccharibacteria bacterium]|jgi:beta-lactamase class A|nr:serine hydrolase [Candidatus Saccharibacteria bacterium]
MVERYRHYQPNRQRREVKQKPPRHRGRRILFVAIIAIGLYVGFMKLNDSRISSQQSEEAKKASSQPVVKQIDQTVWDHINQVVAISVADNPSLDISVSLVDVKTNTARDFGAQETFAGASTTKVLTAVAYLKQVEEGKKTLDQDISGSTATHHLQQMINQSNNESWSALNRTVGHTELEAYAHSIGMGSYQFSGNTLQTKDEALLLAKLTRGELITKEHRAILYSYMQNTNNEDMISAVIPENAVVHHKYGELEDRLHDAAIIDYKNRPLVLVIFTKGVPATGKNYVVHTKLIQSVAENVFNIFYQNL